MMTFWKIVKRVDIISTDPEVVMSQVAASTKLVPLLYLVGNANTIALAYTHYNVAPKLLTLIVPIPMMLFCFLRMLVWNRTRHRPLTAAQAKTRLRSMLFIAGFLGAVYALWALALYPYGDDYARAHVAFFMSTSAIATIFCLMHFRAAALLLTAIITVPFMVRFMTTGHTALTAMAINYLLVVIVMVIILTRYYKDFTALIASQKRLYALSTINDQRANSDSLTGLPNRRSFFANVTRILEQDANGGKVFALGLADLDGFKPINDVFGHGAGDRVLIEVGQRLKNALGPDAFVARLGGDEFGFLLPLDDGSQDVLAKGDAACHAIKEPIPLQNGFANVSASIGFALGINEGATWEHLLEEADYALFSAKSTQSGTSVLFSSQHASAIRMKSLLEQELRRADFNVEMSMHFQAIMDVGCQRILAYEALARWRSPSLGDVSPVDFIAAAERTGLINQLTETLFAKALTAMATWPEDIDLSFNLSVRDLSCANLIDRMRAMIGTSGIAPKRIAFEITETAMINDFEQAGDMLRRLKGLGVQISLDDFGTGYSSLSYVHRLPLDKIKIDRGFVQDIATQQTSRDIIKSIIDLCRNLKITCIVEGVETAEQIKILRGLGCTTMQGYYLGRPIKADDLSFVGHVSHTRMVEAQKAQSHERSVA